MTITLPLALDRLVKDKISSGLYADESEVICEALRRESDEDAVIGFKSRRRLALLNLMRETTRT